VRSASVIGAFLVLFCVVTRGPARADDVGASSPDLIVRVGSDATGPVDKGHAIRYMLAVQNAGGSIAHHVTVEDALPRGVTPINLLPTIDGGTCSAVGSTDPGSTYTVVCSRATLAPAESASVTIDARVDRDRRCGTIRNVVTVGATDEPSTARGDDTASHADVVRCEASLRVEGPGPTFARVGATARTVFHILNDGEVRLHGLTLVGTDCSGLGGRLGSGLRPDHRRTVTCGVLITAGDDAPVVSVHVTAISPEGRRVEASASSTIHVIHPSVALSFPAAPISSRPGDPVTVPIVVTNTGDSALRGVVVSREGVGIVGKVETLRPGAP
jgi:uncharacterized repeat protein (TIGR01451 family)